MSSTKKTSTKKTTAKKTATKTAGPRAAAAEEAPIIAFAEPRAWSDWLAAHHASSRGVWLKLAKKASGVASITYPEALEVALAWGWIDGLKRSHDDASWLQKFTPRGPKSLWSKINREKAMALIAAGEMKPSGLAEVERAKKDGRWEAAYDSPSKATVPEDLAAALAKNPRAAAFFATLNAANRYAVLFRIHTAKKPETRAKRIAAFVEMLAKGEKLHP
ncbi:YdeI/OmpD-associated family protein [Polyangium aurulentum]|uniref:YdeI/OmpD-associated family protein n=1 Tax=Polyangium aurulentum TaxID=2567896 RepID=UPI0010AEC7E7|nr:YdeI/OmpD-associated family protein [Polyangium aurulentum]UQA57600.1 YdeI/OmpD-associated family protein [Polyangium aurulentum]